MKNFFRRLLVVFVLLFSFQPSFAEDDDSYTAGGLFPPLQYPSEDEAVIGLRVSPGWAKHKNVYGLDFGTIGNITTSNFVGMAFSGVFNRTEGSATILLIQAAGVANYNKAKTNVIGMQWALGFNYGAAQHDIYGLQIALGGNFGAKTKIYGFQVGIYNEAESVYGFQLGLVNKTKNLSGIQIGLINYHANGWLPVFPVINIGF